MLTDYEFKKWCSDQKLSKLSISTLTDIRSSEPARRVGGGRKNVSGFYPSKKNQKSIQFESHKVELPFIYELEHDESVLEYYDQPPAFKINYQSKSGRNLGFFYTPDFFVIRASSAGWVECKTEKELQKLLVKQPHRYSFNSDGYWFSPPALSYAAQFGFDFQIFSDAKINWILYRNLTFLEDYYRAIDESKNLRNRSDELIENLVRAQPGITLNQLLDNKLGISADSIYFLIASEQIYIDLGACLLVEPEQCQVFCDLEYASSHKSIFLSLRSADTITLPVINLVTKEQINWDGQIYTLIKVGHTQITLRSELGELIDLPVTELESKIRLGQITVNKQMYAGSNPDELNSRLRGASQKDLEDANRRYRSIEPILLGQKIENPTVPERTLRDWLAKYKQAQQQYGYGYIGLLNHSNKKGNRNRKLPEQILELINEFITQSYETHKQKRKYEVYGAFCNACANAGIPDDQIPSYKTFISEIKQRSGWHQTCSREGHRAAYPQQSFYWELELTTPKHGDRSLEVCHIDHTKLDIELRCSHTDQVLGRPWATFLVDAYSRRILAVYLTFDPPSYRSCMMVLRICVMRYSRLPQIIVTDNGKEFHSTYFESLLALFECTLKHRPPAASRFSGVCERLFGTANTQFVYNLAGNTQITKKVRLMTKTVNPKNLAIWTLGLLYLYLCEWAYSEYDTTEHPALGMSPSDAFNQGIAKYGLRTHRLIPWDENLRILTLPTTQSQKVKVHPVQGIQIRGIHYWNSAFRDPSIHKTYVAIRYDPFDIGIAYAYVRGQWIECISEYYAAFKGRSEKEIWLATTELQKRKTNHHQEFKVRAKKLAEFLSSAEAEEVLLAQRLRDNQGKEVFKLIECERNKIQFHESLNMTETVAVEPSENKNLESVKVESVTQIPTKLQIFDSY
jgi:putative transposase